MKVALLSRFALPYHDFGGLQWHLYYLVKHLLLNNIEVYLYLQKPYYRSNLFESNPHFHPHFIDHIRLPFGKIKRTVILDRITNYPLLCLKMAKKVIQKHQTEKFDIIHAHGLPSFGYARYIRKYPQILPPMIMNPHGLEEFKIKNPYKRIMYSFFRNLTRLGAQYSQKVIATDKCTVEEIVKYLNVPESKVVVLPNAVDEEECLAFIDNNIKKNLMEKFSLSKRSLILLSVGRLERNKGYHLLIEALAQIKEKLPTNWLWLLVGEGSDRKLLENKLNTLQLNSYAKIIGSLTDVQIHNLYELTHVFLHPTLYEGSSIVTLEAMVHRCPIVASATGGLPDKVKDNYNGFLCEPGNVDDLGEKILKLIQRKKDFQIMGDNSFNLVKKEFSWNKIIKGYIQIYQDMIKNRAKTNFTLRK